MGRSGVKCVTVVFSEFQVISVMVSISLATSVGLPSGVVGGISTMTWGAPLMRNKGGRPEGLMGVGGRL